MRFRRFKRKLVGVFQTLFYAGVVFGQMLGAAFLVLFRKTDLNLLKYNRTVRVCVTIGFLVFAGAIVYAYLHRWPWPVDVFLGWQGIRLIVFTGSMFFADRSEEYELVDGRRWR